MVCVSIAFSLCLCLRLGNSHATPYHQFLRESQQRMAHEHLRKEKLDEFVIKKRKTFVVTPAFDMHVNEDKFITTKKPVILFTEILDDGVVRNELTTVKRENNIVLGKVAVSATRLRDNDLKNIHHTMQPLLFKNIQTVETPQLPMINILEKQNEMIEKLVSLYQKELKHNLKNKMKVLRDTNTTKNNEETNTVDQVKNDEESLGADVEVAGQGQDNGGELESRVGSKEATTEGTNPREDHITEAGNPSDEHITEEVNPSEEPITEEPATEEVSSEESTTDKTKKPTTKSNHIKKPLIYRFYKTEVIKELRKNPWINAIVRKAFQDKAEYFKNYEEEQKQKNETVKRL